MSVAERLSDAQAVVGLMNSVFRHSECGPLRAETVLRSCAAQVCVWLSLLVLLVLLLRLLLLLLLLYRLGC